MLPSFRIDADGSGKRLRVCVIGVIGVREFSECEVTVVTKKESLTLVGENLKITVFESRAVEISGQISGISIDVRKRGERRV